MKIRKILSAIVAAAMVLTLTACNKKEKASTPSETLSSSSETEDISESTSSTSEEISSNSSTAEENPIDTNIIPEAPASDFEYEYTDNNEIRITKYNGFATAVKIPSKIDGIVVREIGEEAFRGNSNVTSVIIPNGVTTICDTWYIGGGAFLGCSNLKSITIPNSVTKIGSFAFGGCVSLLSVTIPNSVTYIGDRAFTGCHDLTSVTIPNSVTAIEEFAFSGCLGLKKITIPNSVTTIKQGMFFGSKGLTNVTIPNSVTEIGLYAFVGCEGLTSITIPDSVTVIGHEAFRRCTGLTRINVDNNNQNYTSNDGVLYNKDMTTLIRCPAKKQGSFTIPNSVTSIENYAFEDCTGLTRINVDNNNKIYTSNDGVVYSKDMTSLVCFPEGKQGEFTIPDSVVEIGEWAFDDCTRLTSITIPDSVVEIGEWAFYDCTGLTSITIPESVSYIGEQAFSGCSAEITYKGQTYTPGNYEELYKAING